MEDVYNASSCSGKYLAVEGSILPHLPFCTSNCYLYHSQSQILLSIVIVSHINDIDSPLTQGNVLLVGSLIHILC